MINESIVTPKNSILCVGVKTDSLNSGQTLVAEEGRLPRLWSLTFLRFYGL